MTRLTLRTPSRLHFGLFSWGSKAVRQFGGVGLMIDRPGLILSARSAEAWDATGPLAGRILEFAQRITETLSRQGVAIQPTAFVVRQMPPEHAGLGVGTQLGLGVARLLTDLAGLPGWSSPKLAEISGRGVRSGIGLHGFDLGGLIVDGGQGPGSIIPPLLTRLEFPSHWYALVVIPRKDPGLHGQREVQAFANLPPFAEALTDQLCRLVLLGLLPAVVERDLPRFGEALGEIQRRVGEGFASVQGGMFASPDSELILAILNREGLRGIGQSSWGPALYGFSDASPEERAALFDRIQERLQLDSGSMFWTQASAAGASIEVESAD